MPAILERRPSASPTQVHGATALHAGEDPLDSRRLLQGRNEILIRHGSETYRLRHTRNDKLILTK